MPKVELHAHLNGSVRHTTLLELADGHPRIEREAVHRLSCKGAPTSLPPLYRLAPQPRVTPSLMFQGTERLASALSSSMLFTR